MNRKVQIAVYCLLLLCLTVGCRDEMFTPDTPGGGNTVLPDGRVVYSLHTTAPDFARPVTRNGTANEDAAEGDLWVFVFDATTANPDDGLFVEAVKASDHEAVGTGASKRTITLSTRTTPVTLIVLDNTPTDYYPGSGSTDVPITDAASWGLTAGTTKLSDARTMINTVRLATPSVSHVPYTVPVPQSIPLSIEKSYPKLDPSIDLGTEASPLGLKRVVARLTVKKDFTSVTGNANTPPFALKGATVYNTPRNASLFPVHKSNAGNLTNYIGSTGSEITGIAAATNDDTATTPIYLYPSAEADAANQPFVLIQADYNNDGYDTYYKLAIAPAGKPVGRVERNTDYRLLIKSCTGRGYTTITEAAANPPSNLIATIEVTDLSSHDIIDNGQYYIGVDASEVYIYDYITTTISNFPLFTLTHNAPTSVTLRTISHDAGPTLTGLTAFPSAGTTTTITANLSSAFKGCTITIKLGNLSKTIKVTRGRMDAHSLNGALLGKGFLYAGHEGSDAQTWHSLTTSSLGSLDPSTKVNYGNLDPDKDLYITAEDFLPSPDKYATSDNESRTATIRLFSNRGNTIIRLTQPAGFYAGLFGGSFDATASGTGYTEPLFYERVEEEIDIPWYENTTTTTGVTNKVHGKAGTVTLTNAPHINKALAATYCRNRNRDINGNGTIDDDEVVWYLPAQNQLMAAWVVNTAHTVNFLRSITSDGYYRSATETDARYSWGTLFTSGYTQGFITKPSIDNKKARCVRDLNP